MSAATINIKCLQGPAWLMFFQESKCRMIGGGKVLIVHPPPSCKKEDCIEEQNEMILRLVHILLTGRVL